MKKVYAVHAPDPDTEAEKAEQISRELSNQTGLISEERKGEQLRFIHLSFVEYFAALHAIEHTSNGWKQLLNRHQANQQFPETTLATRLREVFPFAVQLAHEKDQSAYLADICRTLQDNRLKASCFLETKAYQSEAWLDFAGELPEALRSLLPRLQNEVDAQTFYTLVAALRDAEAHGYGMSGSATGNLDDTLRIILEGDKALAFRAVELMARYDAVAALRLADLCRLPLLKEHPWFLIQNCEQPAFLAQVIQRALADQDDRDAWLVYAGMASCLVRPARAELLTQEPRPAFEPTDPSAERFWAQLCGSKRSLLTQILGRIAIMAKDGSRLRDRLPYHVWRFAIDGLAFEYLRPANRRASFRRGLHRSIDNLPHMLMLGVGIIGAIYAFQLGNAGIFTTYLIIAFVTFSTIMILYSSAEKVFRGLPSMTHLVLSVIAYGGRSWAIVNFYRRLEHLNQCIICGARSRKEPSDLYFNRTFGRKEARIYMIIQHNLAAREES